MIRRSSLCFLALLLGSAFALAAEPEPKLAGQFFEKLEAADGLAAQDQAIASRDPAISEEGVRRQLLKHIYGVVLEGEYLRAARDCDLVMRLARAAGSEEDVAAAQINLGYIRRESGDLAGSLETLDQALAFYISHPEHIHGLISAHQSRGITYLAQSDFAHALESFHRALAFSEKIGHRDGIIPALNSIGEVYRNQGQPERALEFYERARQAVGDDDAWNMAFIFNNIAMSYDALGDYDRAIENIQRARAVAEQVKFRPRVENALAVLGDLELKRGRLDPARDHYAESLGLARDLHDVPGEAQATLGLAQVAHARGENSVALEQARKASDLFRKLAETVPLATALTLSGRCLQALHHASEAEAAFAQAIAAVEAVRGQVAGGDVEREQFFAQQIAPYHEMISLLVRQNKAPQALAMAERVSARVLLDITAGGRTALAAVLSPAEEKTQREIEIKLASAGRELARLRTAPKPDATAIIQAEKTHRETLASREEFETLAATIHPELRRALPPPPLAVVNDLIPLLGQGKTALLRYVVTDDDCYLFVITKSSPEGPPLLTLKSLGKTRRELSALTNDFRARLAARSLAWEDPARRLYDLLLRPVEPQLAGVNSLVIVPDGPLWELPFQALESDRDRPVLAARSVRYASSLTVLVRLQQQTQPVAAPRELLAFINPALRPTKETEGVTKVALMNKEWEALPQTEKQAPELAKIYPAPGGEILVGLAARESVFKEKAGSAGILHFATHGVLDDRAPLYSYLLFSQVGVAPNEDGRLEARELMQLKLRAHLAILCGCETARGQVTAGEGMVGLSWGFMVAGCPATIVSQWKVDSASSTPLMVELHRQLHAGVGNTEALRSASLELRKDTRYRHPFYWAPFVLIGASP